jgi:hypothetical protein
MILKNRITPPSGHVEPRCKKRRAKKHPDMIRNDMSHRMHLLPAVFSTPPFR